MVMAGPGIQPGQRRTNLVSLIDVCPTLIEMGGLAPHRAALEGLDGESLLPLATGQTGESRDWALACFMGCTFNTSGYMLRKGRFKYVAYVGYPAQLFDIERDSGELVDLCGTHPEVAQRLDADLRAILDYEQTHRDWLSYCKSAFGQWRRQAKRGLYVDASYALRGAPSSDYWQIMDNAFTGYNRDDEEKVARWLDE
jgi:arylsulfatase A-like enzyme